MTDDPLEAGPVRIPLSEISFAFSRSGGPGGQNVNKVETRVEVRFRPSASAALTPAQVARIRKALASRLTKEGDLVVVSDRTRYRERNREDALERLAEMLAGALAVRKKRIPTRPSRAARERRLTEKRRRSEKKRIRREPPEA